MEELNVITKRIIGCGYTVSNALGVGFLEKVYENALVHEMHKNDLRVDQQRPIQVFYDGVLVGDYLADILVEDTVLVELKAVKTIENTHVAQCLNYLKATELKVCLLLNFGEPKLGIKRLVM